MGILLLAVFIGVPLLEIAVFIEIGEAIGLWPTLATVILTAMIGTWSLRVQGLATLARARAQLDQGTLPTRELFDGACLLIAGALLLTPGFVTDAAGFLLFLSPVRDFLRGVLARYVEGRAGQMKTHVFVDGQEVHGQRPSGPVIDGDFDEVENPPEDPKGKGRPRLRP